MTTLDVPGARLSYEVAGDGPLVVFIPGAGGEGAGFHPVAQRLASSYRVLTYDRRGFGASVLDGPQDYSVRLHTDADDVARLIRQEGGRARVFGSSSGAIVALQLLIDHPDVVEMLLAHEPPAVRRLPEAEAEASLAGDRQMYETYRASGLQAAIGPFLMLVMSASDRATLAQNAHRGDPAQSARNFDYWFEHELPYYPGTVFDDARLKANLDRLVFVAGEETRGLMPHQVAETFAEQLGRRWKSCRAATSATSLSPKAWLAASSTSSPAVPRPWRPPDPSRRPGMSRRYRRRRKQASRSRPRLLSSPPKGGDRL